MRKTHSFLLIVLAASAVPTWYAFTHGYRETTTYACVRCRAIQHATKFFGHESARVEETEHSRWFAQRQPAHTHQWGWCGTTMTYYPFAVGRGCGRSHPVWQIIPDVQRVFVENASASEIEKFFAELESPDRAVQQHAISMAYGTAIGLISSPQ